MKNTVLIIGFCFVMSVLHTQLVYAQEGGITASASDLQSDLPPGATYQGGQVRHIVSANENLHLLAGFYYGDPRQWSRIYRENRAAIPNPRVLRVGQKLMISVQEGWKPLFPYQEWFRQATRNGEWSPQGRKRVSPKPERRPGVQPAKPQTNIVPAEVEDVPDISPEDMSQDEASVGEEYEEAETSTADNTEEDVPPAGIY